MDVLLGIMLGVLATTLFVAACVLPRATRQAALIRQAQARSVLAVLVTRRDVDPAAPAFRFVWNLATADLRRISSWSLVRATVALLRSADAGSEAHTEFLSAITAALRDLRACTGDDALRRMAEEVVIAVCDYVRTIWIIRLLVVIAWCCAAATTATRPVVALVFAAKELWAEAEGAVGSSAPRQTPTPAC